MKRSAFDELLSALPAAVRNHIEGRVAKTRRKLAPKPKPVTRHIVLSSIERKLVERAAAILEVAPEAYARHALVAQSRSVVELHARGHFRKERG